MRGFVSGLVGALCALCLIGNCLAAEPSRAKLNFDFDWRFIKQDMPGAQAPAFNDSTWTSISCPHTYNDTDTFDDFSLPNHRGEQNQFGGRTWYRKTFTAPQSWDGKMIYIEFE